MRANARSAFADVPLNIPKILLSLPMRTFLFFLCKYSNLNHNSNHIDLRSNDFDILFFAFDSFRIFRYTDTQFPSTAPVSLYQRTLIQLKWARACWIKIFHVVDCRRFVLVGVKDCIYDRSTNVRSRTRASRTKKHNTFELLKMWTQFACNRIQLILHIFLLIKNVYDYMQKVRGEM